MGKVKVRHIQEIGTRAWLRVYWGGSDVGDPCPGGYGYHNAKIHLCDSAKLNDWDLSGKPEDYPDERWPTLCETCGTPVPAGATREVFHKRLYNTASGQPEAGDTYWAQWQHDPELKKYYCPWDNCNDPRGHLIVVLPNGHEWDIDSRASNCTMKEERTHRCWVRHGEPPNVHVDKGGHTCAAGAGSIVSGDYHGFLHNGKLIKL